VLETSQDGFTLGSVQARLHYRRGPGTVLAPGPSRTRLSSIASSNLFVGERVLNHPGYHPSPRTISFPGICGDELVDEYDWGWGLYSCRNGARTKSQRKLSKDKVASKVSQVPVPSGVPSGTFRHGSGGRPAEGLGHSRVFLAILTVVCGEALP
jgi:hypothetical protein